MFGQPSIITEHVIAVVRMSEQGEDMIGIIMDDTLLAKGRRDEVLDTAWQIANELGAYLGAVIQFHNIAAKNHHETSHLWGWDEIAETINHQNNLIRQSQQKMRREARQAARIIKMTRQAQQIEGRDIVFITKMMEGDALKIGLIVNRNLIGSADYEAAAPFIKTVGHNLAVHIDGWCQYHDILDRNIKADDEFWSRGRIVTTLYEDHKRRRERVRQKRRNVKRAHRNRALKSMAQRHARATSTSGS